MLDMRATKKRIVLIASIIVGVPIVVAALIGAAGHIARYTPLSARAR